MQQFKIRPEGFKQIRKKQLLQSIPILLLAAIGGLVISSMNSTAKEGNVNTLPFVIPIVLIALGFGVYRGLNRRKNLLNSYILTITDNLIERQQNDTAKISIYFNDISEISKGKDESFTIKGKTSTETILVPSQIENYNQLEQLLNTIKPIKENVTESILQKQRNLISLLTLALMAIVYVSKDKILVGISGAILVGLLSWSFYEIRTSKNVDNKTKKGVWWVLFVLAGIIGVTILKLTGHYYN